MSEPQLVCFGVGSEYVLAPLAEEARRRGIRVCEIDMYRSDWRKMAASCIERPFVLVTSHHPYLDGWAHMEGFKTPADLDTVASFVHRERPIRTFFIPHDLSDNLHPEELYSLHLFDALLMPDECYWFLRAHVRVESVGWIKSAAATKLPHVPLTLMPSEVAFYSQNPELFTARFASYLKRSPRFKLASFADTGRLEKIAREAGCEIVPSEVSSTSLIMATSIVITNATSSIVQEAAAMGLPTLCLLDGLPSIAEQRRAFQYHPQVVLLSPDKGNEWLDRVMTTSGSFESRNVGFQPFDFDRTFALILGGD